MGYNYTVILAERAQMRKDRQSEFIIKRSGIAT